MKSWLERPIEVAYLLNPAFCGEVLLKCIAAYTKTAKRPFPYLLAFLVLPLTLHSDTRASMSSGAKTNLHVWINSHKENLIGFAERARNLAPITRESMIFLLQSDAVSMNQYGSLRVKRRYTKGRKFKPDDEMSDCFKKAEILGKWFARAGTITTVYAMLGVRP